MQDSAREDTGDEMTITYVSTNELGKVLYTKTEGKRTMIFREYGIEKFTSALNPEKSKLEVVAVFGHRIMNIKQVKYLIKRKKKNGGIDGGTKTTT